MANNIIDKIQISGQSYDVKDSSAATVVELTQQEYNDLPSSAKTGNTLFVITDAQAGDLTNYYTKSETNTLLGGKADTATTYTKTEVDNAITAATSTKQDTLVSGTNIKTINNESILGSGNIDIQGGSTYTAGRGIDITNDTISFSLPISAGTGTNALVIASDTFEINNKAKGNYSVCLNGGGLHPNYAYGISSLAQGMDTKAYGNACYSEGYGSKAGVQNNINIQFAHAEGDHTQAKGTASHAEGSYTIANNLAEHASGRYNISSSASTTFGDSGNTLFSVGNGTSASATHNAFEIRQNGDIYLSLNGQDVKLQDQLGGSSITVDTELDSGSTNPVQNQALYSELRIDNGETETTLTFENGYSTNYPNGCTKIKVEDISSNSYGSIRFVNNEGYTQGTINITNFGNISVNTNSFEGATYEISGTTVIITYPTVTNVTEIEVDNGDYVYKAIVALATPLKNQVIANTTALGGLKLVKLSQSEYDSLATKDNSTLYVIVN